MRVRTTFGDVDDRRPSGPREVWYSPMVVEKIVYARSKCASSAAAADLLRVLAEIQVSAEEVDLIIARVAQRAPGPK